MRFLTWRELPLQRTFPPAKGPWSHRGQSEPPGGGSRRATPQSASSQRPASGQTLFRKRTSSDLATHRGRGISPSAPASLLHCHSLPPLPERMGRGRWQCPGGLAAASCSQSREGQLDLYCAADRAGHEPFLKASDAEDSSCPARGRDALLRPVRPPPCLEPGLSLALHWEGRQLLPACLGEPFIDSRRGCLLSPCDRKKPGCPRR